MAEISYASAPHRFGKANPYQDVDGLKRESMYSRGHGNTNPAAMPGLGQGKDYTIYRQGQALNTLQGGVTNAEGGDYANRETLRQALGEQMAAYGGQADTRERNFMATQERGLANNAAQLRRQMGGTGMSRTTQGNRSFGDLLAGAQRATGEGLNQLQLQKGEELGQFSNINQQNLMQSLAERGYNMQQAKTLSDLLQQQAMVEQNSILGTATQPGPSGFEQALGYGLNALGVGVQAKQAFK